MKTKAALPNTRTLTVESPSATVEVEYSPKWLSTKEGKKAVARLRQARDGAERLQAFIEFVPQLLTGWNLVDDEGKPLAPTKELLAQMPMGWLQALFYALMDDVQQVRQQFEAQGGQRYGRAGRAISRLH